MRMCRRSIALACLAAGLLLQGCATRREIVKPTPPPEVTPQAPLLYEWNGDGLSGPVRVVINLSTQRAQIFIGEQFAGWTVVATGKEGYGTPAGNYVVLEKKVEKYSTLYGKIVDAEGNTVNSDADTRKHQPPPGGRFDLAPMPYWMRLTWRGVGMHAGPIPRPGSPVSHGCIRLPREMAKTLYDLVEIGTPVRIVR
jgi:lipoprotein-anchoring transpeptidase ErfK/SrfK